MSNNEKNNPNFVQKINLAIPKIDGTPIFSFSSLKSKKIIFSDYFNSFNFNFSRDNSNLKKTSKKIKNDKKMSLKENDISDINSCFLRTHNTGPISENLWKQKNEIDLFLKEYNNSFAHFCGINKEEFKDLLENNHYKPVLNEFGDIILPKKLLDFSKADSFCSKANKKFLTKKIFKINQKETIIEKNNTFEENKRIKNSSNLSENIEKIKNFNNNFNNKSNDLTKENYNYNNKNSLINIKESISQEKGYIIIPNNQKIHNDKTPIKSSPFSKEFLEHFQINSNDDNNNNNYDNYNNYYYNYNDRSTQDIFIFNNNLLNL